MPPDDEYDPDGQAAAEDVAEPEVAIAEPFAGKIFDPEPQREARRGHLALAAFGVFVVFVLIITLAVVCGWRQWSELDGLVTAVLPTIVGLVGTIGGFYFGATQRK